MRKTVFLTALLLGLCLFSACGAETETASSIVTETAAVMDTSTEESGTGVKTAAKATTKAAVKVSPKDGNTGISVPAVSVTLPDPEITAVSLTHSGDAPIVLDLEEKRGSFAAHVEASGYVQKDLLHIYTEDETLVEVSDITVKSGGLVNFYLTGKKAGTSNLYIATADGRLVSEPVALQVRSAEEKEKAERPIYYTPLGEYWHFSEDCAREDYPGVTYDWKGNQHEVDRSTIRVLEMPQGMVVGDKKACPKCAAEESSQQDGE